MTHQLLIGLAAVALLGQAQTSEPPRSGKSRPYTVEFVRAGKPAQPGPVTVQTDQKPVVIERNPVLRGPCNMPIIAADARIDPRMIVPIERKNTDPKIRVIEPLACGSAVRAEEVIKR